MNKEIINKILYLTHDKWKIQVKYRKEFETFLIDIVTHCPEAEKTLEMIVEYAGKGDKLVIIKGVFNILEREHPKEYEFIATRTKVKEMKKKFNI